MTHPPASLPLLLGKAWHGWLLAVPASLAVWAQADWRWALAAFAVLGFYFLLDGLAVCYLSLFGSLMLLNAEFTSDNPPECDGNPALPSCLHGKTPAYAPDYIVRAGVEYVFPEIFKISLLTTAVSNQYGDDNNTPDFFLPHYTVSDLTMEANVWGETAALYFGVNNIFDEDYYARIRSDGIMPAYARNYYGGFKVYF